MRRALLWLLVLPLPAFAHEERARVVREAMRAKGYRVRHRQIGGEGAPRITITVSGTLQLQ